MQRPVHSSCSVVLSFFLCIFLALPAQAAPSAEADKLFRNALQQYPLKSISSKNKQAVAAAAAAYGKAAAAGHPEALLLCTYLLNEAGQKEKLFPLLVRMDAPQNIRLSFRKEVLAKINMHKFPGGEEALCDSLHIQLRDLYMFGIGTKQDYAKARAANNRIRSVLTQRMKLQDELFEHPLSADAQYAFWKHYKASPEAGRFFEGALSAGKEVSSFDIDHHVQNMSSSAKLAFYEKYAATNPQMAYNAGLMILSDPFVDFDLAKAANHVQRAAKGFPEAAKLQESMPGDLKDTEGLKRLALYLREKTQGTPRWLALIQAREVNAGILNTPLQPGFILTPSSEETTLIQAYEVAKDQKAFLKQVFSRQKKDVPYFALYVYADLAENTPSLFREFEYNLKDAGDLNNYPPYLTYMAQRFLQERASLSEEDRTEVNLRALVFLNQAAEKGYPPAMAMQAAMLTSFNKGIQSDYCKGFALYIQAARMGNADSLLALINLPEDEGEAKERERTLLRAAAAKGSAAAAEKLAASGENIPLDRNALIRQTLARNGSLWEQAIALINAAPGDAPDNLFKGMSLLWYAAEKQNSAQAQTLLGDLFYSGTILPQDYRQAMAFYKRSLKQFPLRNCVNRWPISEMYLLGLGTAQNMKTSLAYLQQGECSDDWAEERSNKSIPKLAESSGPREDFPPRHEPDLDRVLEHDEYPTVEVEKVKAYGNSKKLLLRLFGGSWPVE